jgi:O-antigen/teichoic acid export membrane protein
MKALTQRILSNPKYSRIINWSKLLTLTGSAQALIQGLSLVTGIVIIRLLPVEEYAYYTLANTMLGTMTILADGGISSGTMAEGSKVWEDKTKLGKVLATGSALRKVFAKYSITISVLILAYLLWSHGASWITITLISLALIPSFYASLTDILLEIVPKLHQELGPLQKNQINVSLGRLAISVGFLIIFPWTFIALLANGIPRIYGNYRLKELAYRFADKNQLPDKEVKRKILRIVGRMMPENIYYCLSGQLTIWLISIFGSTTELASLGAVSRLALLINPFTVIFGILVVPRFVKLANEKWILCKTALTILTVSVLLSGIIMFMIYLFSDEVLQILGPEYGGLNSELFLSMLGGCLSLIHGFFFAMMVNKGWVINPIIYISINVIATIICVSVVNLNTVNGVLIFNCIIAAIQALTLISYCFIRIFNIGKSSKYNKL